MSHVRVMVPSEATVLEALGCRLRFLVRGDQTDGAFSMMELEIPPSFVGPPIFHAHTREDWWGTVTSGEIALELPERTIAVPEGGTVFVPRTTPFRYTNPLSKPTRWTITWAPGGFERYFVELVHAIHETPPKEPAELGALARPLWQKYALEIVG
jgi:mannose-6-phosphate isomerase-like protein (cupin superfamily)